MLTPIPRLFENLVKELASLLTYEATCDMQIAPVDVQTPLAVAHGNQLADTIGLVPILRAGLGGPGGLGINAFG